MSEPGQAPGRRWCEARGVLPSSPVRRCFGRSRGGYLLPTGVSLSTAFFYSGVPGCALPAASSCPRLGSRGYLGGKQNKKGVALLPAFIPELWLMFRDESKYIIVPQCPERLRPAGGSHRSRQSQVRFCTAASEGLETRPHFRAEFS